MIYILSILFTMCFVYYSKYQFINSRAGHWHIFGMLMRILALVSSFIISYFTTSWKDYLLAGVINIILFDILVNIIALKVKWNYVGTTSWFDKNLGKYKYWIYGLLLLVVSILKLK